MIITRNIKKKKFKNTEDIGCGPAEINKIFLSVNTSVMILIKDQLIMLKKNIHKKLSFLL